MPDRKRDPLPPPIGGASLLAAFAVLCLTVFALLSLSTVRADDRLGKATVQAVTDYYAADLEAQTILARLRNGEHPEAVTIESGGAVTWASYTCPISDAQELRVRVELTAEGGYRVLCWQTAAVEECEFDDSLDLWDGELF